MDFGFSEMFPNQQKPYTASILSGIIPPPPISFEDATYLSSVMKENDDSGSSSSDSYQQYDNPYYLDTSPSDELSPTEAPKEHVKPPTKKRKHTKKSSQQQPSSTPTINTTTSTGNNNNNSNLIINSTINNIGNTTGSNNISSNNNVNSYTTINSNNTITTTSLNDILNVSQTGNNQDGKQQLRHPQLPPINAIDKHSKSQPGRVVMISGGILVQLDSEDDLLKLTSEQIELLLTERRASRDPTFTTEDEKRIRKVRRLIKNREYAQQSRNKKKQYLGDIEKELEQARSESRSLREQVTTLAAKNVELEKENRRLKDLLGFSSTAVTFGDVASPNFNVNNMTLNRGVATSAVLLSILLFAIVFTLPILGPSRSVWSTSPELSSNIITGRTLKSTMNTATITNELYKSLNLLFNNIYYGTKGGNTNNGHMEYWQWQEAFKIHREKLDDTIITSDNNYKTIINNCVIHNVTSLKLCLSLSQTI